MPTRPQCHSRARIGALLAFTAMFTGFSTGAEVSSQSSASTWNPADIVAVTGGCGRISLHDVERAEPVHFGDAIRSIGRLSAGSGFRTWLASWSGHGRPGDTPIVYGLERRDRPDDSARFVTSPILGDDFALRGGLAVLPDGQAFLVSGGYVYHGRPDTHQVRKYAVPAQLNENGPTQIGPRLATYDIDAIPTEIVFADEGRTAHVLTDASSVHTLDTRTMRPSAAPILIPPEQRVHSPGLGNWPVSAAQHASLTRDGSYLVLNQGNGHDLDALPGLTFVDLQARTTRSLSIPNPSFGLPIRFTGGIAVNHGWKNAGLLALHTMDSVRVLELMPDGSLRHLAHKAVREMPLNRGFQVSGPWPSIAWSTDGSKLIASVGEGYLEKDAEFVVLDVLEEGRVLRFSHEFVACEDPMNHNHPDDIFTLNGRVLPPAPTGNPSQTITPQATAEPSLTSTRVPSPSATASPSASQTPAATADAGSTIFLPIAHHE